MCLQELEGSGELLRVRDGAAQRRLTAENRSVGKA